MTSASIGTNVNKQQIRRPDFTGGTQNSRHHTHGPITAAATALRAAVEPVLNPHKTPKIHKIHKIQGLVI